MFRVIELKEVEFKEVELKDGELKDGELKDGEGRPEYRWPKYRWPEYRWPEYQGKVLPAADYRILLDAEGVLQQARHSADEWQRLAQLHYGQEGLRGYQQGLQQARTEALGQQQQTTQYIERHLAALQGRLTQLLLQALAQLLGSLDKGELAAALVSQALTQLREQEALKIRVSPQVVEAVRQRLTDSDFNARARLVADPGLADDSCVIEGAGVRLTADLQQQLQALHGLWLAAGATEEDGGQHGEQL